MISIIKMVELGLKKKLLLKWNYIGHNIRTEKYIIKIHNYTRTGGDIQEIIISAVKNA